VSVRAASDRLCVSAKGETMQLEGIHHVTAITGDAPRNLDFYVRVLGLRLVKKTVNQDDVSVYHLFYGDDEGSPGHDLTFFDYPGALPGRAGAGMVHTVAVRVAGPGALSYWAGRLEAEGVASEHTGATLRFADPEGLRVELVVEDVPDRPLTATSDVPPEHRLQGFAGVRAYSARPSRSTPLLTTGLGFRPDGDRYTARGAERGGWIAYDSPPALPGSQSAGTVHHVAWATTDADQLAWRQRVIDAGAVPTPVIDRYYFHSVYFREPSGVLFELATTDGPGFAIDEPLEHLGEQLSLPPFLESRRAEIERRLKPLPDVRTLVRGRP
jgi:glyoxalase family protein